MEKRGVRFRNEFLALYLHAVTNVPLEVDHERRTVHGSAPVTTHESLLEPSRLRTSDDLLLRLVVFLANSFSSLSRDPIFFLKLAFTSPNIMRIQAAIN